MHFLYTAARWLIFIHDISAWHLVSIITHYLHGHDTFLLTCSQRPSRTLDLDYQRRRARTIDAQGRAFRRRTVPRLSDQGSQRNSSGKSHSVERSYCATASYPRVSYTVGLMYPAAYWLPPWRKWEYGSGPEWKNFVICSDSSAMSSR